MGQSSDSSTDSAREHVVVIGASAGGVETLVRVVSDLPPELPASVCIVLHLAPGSPSSLPAILQRRCRLPCRAPVDGEALRAGTILVAPPDHHLIIEDGHVWLTVDPRENGHRPSVDALFRTAAAAHDGRVVGVILSGTRDDGTAGLAAIKAQGGVAIVQDPSDALYPGMPASAIASVAVDIVVPADRVAEAIVQAVTDPRGGMLLGADNPGRAGNPGHADNPGSGGNALPSRGALTTTCPECGGVLTERSGASVTQWQCRVGHRYSPESLADAQAQGVGAALWAAVRALEDRQALLERMGQQAGARELAKSARSFRERAAEAGAQAATVRGALEHAARTTLQTAADSEAVDSERQRLG